MKSLRINCSSSTRQKPKASICQQPIRFIVHVTRLHWLTSTLCLKRTILKKATNTYAVWAENHAFNKTNSHKSHDAFFNSCARRNDTVMYFLLVYRRVCLYNQEHLETLSVNRHHRLGILYGLAQTSSGAAFCTRTALFTRRGLAKGRIQVTTMLCWSKQHYQQKVWFSIHHKTSEIQLLWVEGTVCSGA